MVNLHSLRNQILSLARLPFRHARMRTEVPESCQGTTSGVHENHGFATGAVSGTLGTTRRPSLEKAESYQFGAMGAPPLFSDDAQPDERRRRPPTSEERATRAMRMDFMGLESVTGVGSRPSQGGQRHPRAP